MRSVPLAMTWEFLDRGRWMLPAGALAANAMTFLILTALRREGGALPSHHEAVITIHVALMQMHLFVFAAFVLTILGKSSRLYCLPVRTSTMVAWRLIPAMVVAAVEMALSTAVVNSVFALDWPVWGPALTHAVILAAVMSALWIGENSAWIPVVVAIVASPLAIWFKSRYGDPFSMPKHYWQAVTPGEVAMLGVAGWAAYGLGIVGMSRNRQGAPPLSVGILEWLNRLWEGITWRDPTFRSSRQAQWWLEWQRKGWAMPVGGSFLLLMALGFWVVFSRSRDDLWDALAAGGPTLLVLAIITAIMTGNVGPNDANYEMKSFRATRPMTSRTMAQTVMAIVAVSVGLTWLIWCLAFLIAYVLMKLTGSVPASEVLDYYGWWYFPAVLVGAWTIAALGSAISMCGRMQIVVKLMVGIQAIWLGSVLVSATWLSPELRAQIIRASVWLGAIVFPVALMASLAIAYRRRQLGASGVVGSLCVWFALITIALAAGHARHASAIPFVLLVIAVASLAVTPIPVAPLALAANRVR